MPVALGSQPPFPACVPGGSSDSTPKGKGLRVVTFGAGQGMRGQRDRSPWTLPGLVNSCREVKTLTSAPAPSSPPRECMCLRGGGGCAQPTGSLEGGEWWTGRDSLLPGAPWSRHPPETRNSQPTLEPGSQICLAPFQSWAPASVSAERKCPGSPGSRSWQQSITLARSTSGLVFRGSREVSCVHSQEVTVSLTQVGWRSWMGEGEGWGDWHPGF